MNTAPKGVNMYFFCPLKQEVRIKQIKSISAENQKATSSVGMPDLPATGGGLLFSASIFRPPANWPVGEIKPPKREEQ